MAVGLGLLGRGGKRRSLGLWALHVAGAAVGGAAVGGLLGWLGRLGSLAVWRPWLITVTIVVATGLGLCVGQLTLGRQRQVPRRWAPTVSPSRVYIIWGVLLGSAVATPIFYSAVLLLFGAQLTAGPWLGLVSGGIFGAVRQSSALVPMLRCFDSERTMSLLETLRPLARRLNVAVVIGAGLVLLLVGRL